MIACEPPKQNEVAGWITRRAASQHALKVTSEAANVLADLIGADLGSRDRGDAQYVRICSSTERQKV